VRGRAPVVLLGVVVALLLAGYIVFSRRVVRELRADAGRSGQMYARVFRALADPREESGNAALLDLSQSIGALGVPVIVTDTSGRPTAASNLPFTAPLNDPRVREYLATLDQLNAPVVEPGIGAVHFGDSRLTTSLRYIPAILASLLALVFVAGVYTIRTHSRADRERVWAGMARESAHQLATPLSSLSGWLELLRDRASDEVSTSALQHMDGDLERLQRVSHRFERIGRPPRKEKVELGALVTRVGTYFQARVPTLARCCSSGRSRCS
jgi:signal transduction histidine kinase